MAITTKPVNTTIPAEYHRRAELHGIKWTEAIMIGIDILNNDSYTKEKKLIEEIKKLEGKLRFHKKRLVTLRKEREEKETMIKNLSKDQKKFLNGVQERVDRGADLAAISRLFNNEFEKNLSFDEFQEVLKEVVKDDN